MVISLFRYIRINVLFIYNRKLYVVNQLVNYEEIEVG